ncbi:MAG TPA: ABC transporter permease [Feifaniaceae bacterium]|nr:ABC transporter permease [Feifaniaceae bacterium]
MNGKFLFAARKFFRRQEVGIFVIFIVLCAVISALTPYFFKTANIINILRQISNIGIMAVGQAMVIIIAGIDLSVSATLSLSACLVAFLSNHMNSWVAACIALLAGVAVGLINGFLSVKIGIAPFIATLGIQMMARGAAFLITKGIPIKFLSEAGVLGGGAIPLGNGLQLPIPIVIMFAVYGIGLIVLTKTVFGRNLYAVGDNEKSARLSGINADAVKITAYVVSGFLAALAGIINAGNLTTAEASAGDGIESNVIAAVVIGGVSMSGGEGSMVGILIGAAIMGVIKNAFILLNFPATMQTLTIGFLIIASVGIDCITKRRKASHAIMEKSAASLEKNAQNGSGRTR